METSIQFSINKPFPHPSCLVQHLKFTNNKPGRTHVKIEHTITQSQSPTHKVILHKSLEHKPHTLVNSINNLLIGTDVRRNALAVKEKINIPHQQHKTIKIDIKKINQRQKRIIKQRNIINQQTELQKLLHNSSILSNSNNNTFSTKNNKQNIKSKQRLEKQNQQLHNIIIKMKKEHQIQIQSFETERSNYQKQITRLQSNNQNQATQNINNELNVSLQNQLEQVRKLYRVQKQKCGQNRKQQHELRRKIFDLESVNIDILNEIEELKQINYERQEENQKLQRKNKQLEEYLNFSLTELQDVKIEFDQYKDFLTSLFNDSFLIFQIVIQIVDLFQNNCTTDLPPLLLPVKSELISLKQLIINSLSSLAQVSDNQSQRFNIHERLKVKDTLKDIDRTLNQSQKYIKTSADQQIYQNYQNPLYQMILCQATALEETI